MEKSIGKPTSGFLEKNLVEYDFNSIEIAEEFSASSLEKPLLEFVVGYILANLLENLM